MGPLFRKQILFLGLYRSRDSSRSLLHRRILTTALFSGRNWIGTRELDSVLSSRNALAAFFLFFFFANNNFSKKNPCHNFCSKIWGKRGKLKPCGRFEGFCEVIVYVPSLQWREALEHCSPSLLCYGLWAYLQTRHIYNHSS